MAERAFAERDRLRESHREVLAALKEIQPMSRATHSFTMDEVWKAQIKADVAIAKAEAECNL